MKYGIRQELEIYFNRAGVKYAQQRGMFKNHCEAPNG
jgi:hypothetical protein